MRPNDPPEDRVTHNGKRNVVICICGLTACGKSTVAKRLAEKYELKYLSGGSALKALAIEAGFQPSEVGWWETREGIEFIQTRSKDFRFDKEVDMKLLELTEQGNVILDSWTMPWLVKEGFKIWMDASLKVRSKRAAARDGISITEASRFLKEKDKGTQTIYKNLYGFTLGHDFAPFDLILDTDKLRIEDVFCATALVIDHLVMGRGQGNGRGSRLECESRREQRVGARRSRKV